MYILYNFLVLGLKTNEVRANRCIFFHWCVHKNLLHHHHHHLPFGLYLQINFFVRCIVWWTIPLHTIGDHLIALEKSTVKELNIKPNKREMVVAEWHFYCQHFLLVFHSTLAIEIKSKLVFSSSLFLSLLLLL